MGEERSTRDDLKAGRDAFMSRVEGVLEPSYRLATVLLLDHAAAEDAVHDATLRAWNRYRRMAGDVTSFRTWFLSIVVAECRRARWWRRLTLRGRGEGIVPSNGMQDALLRLRPGQRAALFCFFTLDLPIDEAARVLGTSPARVRSRVYRAEARLFPVLEVEEDLFS